MTTANSLERRIVVMVPLRDLVQRDAPLVLPAEAKLVTTFDDPVRAMRCHVITAPYLARVPPFAEAPRIDPEELARHLDHQRQHPAP